MILENVIRSHNPTARAAGFKPKVKVHLCLKTGVSKLKAAIALSKQTCVTIAQANWFIGKLPLPLATIAPETFETIIMSEDEARLVDTNLSPYFDLDWYSASECVAPYGNFGCPPDLSTLPTA